MRRRFGARPTGTSTTTCTETELARQMREAASRTIAAFAAAATPGVKLSEDVAGRGPSHGHALIQPSARASTAVMLTMTAVASAGAGTATDRSTPVTSGPVGAPRPTRVSSTRLGDIAVTSSSGGGAALDVTTGVAAAMSGSSSSSGKCLGRSIAYTSCSNSLPAASNLTAVNRSSQLLLHICTGSDLPDKIVQNTTGLSVAPSTTVASLVELAIQSAARTRGPSPANRQNCRPA